MAGPMKKQPVPDFILNTSPAANDVFITEEGDTLTWTPFISSTPIRNLTIPFTATNLNNVFSTTINSPIQQKALFRFGSSGPFNLWINGKLMVQKETHYDFAKDEFSFYALLQPGPNHIVVMNTHWQDRWTFALTNPLYDHELTHGIIKDRSGRPVSDADVKFFCDNNVVSFTTSNNEGIYALETPETPSTCSLKASKGDLGTWITTLPQSNQKSIRVDLTLGTTATITGQTFMYDAQTPLNAIFLEAFDVATGKLVATAITDEYGEYALANIPPGRYRIQNQNQSASILNGTDQTQHIIEINSWNSSIKLDLILPDSRKGMWSLFTPLDGLPYYELNYVQESPSGTLICGTGGGGFCEYNGVSFDTYNDRKGLNSNIVYDAVYTDENTTWIATAQGINLKKGSHISTVADEKGRSDYHVRTLLKDSKNNIWMGTDNGLARVINDSTFTVPFVSDQLPSQIFHNLVEDADGTVWMGTNLGLAYMNENGFFHVDEFAGTTIRTIYEDQNQTLWLGTHSGLYKKNKDSWKRFTVFDGLIGNMIYDICENEDGLLWIATSHGLSSFNNQRFTNFTMAQGLPSNDVRTLECSGYKMLWVGTQNGLAKMDYSIKSFGLADGLTKVEMNGELAGVFSIFHRSDSIYIGTGWGGLYSFNGSTFTNEFSTGNDTYVRSMSVLPDSNDLQVLLGTHDGTFHYRADTTEQINADGWVLETATDKLRIPLDRSRVGR